MMPAPASSNHGCHARTPATKSMATPHSPAAMKKGNLETAPKTAKKAVGSHHQALPVRIILSVKKRNQSVTTKQRPFVEPRPAIRTTSGCANKNAVPHQAARGPTYWRATWKKGQSPVAKISNEVRLAHPYHVEPVALKAKPVAACHTGNSCAVGVPVALNPTIIGRSRLIELRPYSSAVPRWIARNSDLPSSALPR